jgi:hypothetical protein
MLGDKNETTRQLALRVINDAMLAYAGNPVARALMTVIPFGIGSFVDAFLGTTGSNLMLGRVQALGEEVSEALHRVPAEKRDPAVTEQQLFDATIRAVRGAMETESREKVQLIAAILVGATSLDRPSALDVESVMASIVSLTPADLASARRLADHLGPGTFPAPAELGPDGLFFVTRLQAAGLLESVVLPASPPGSRLGPGYRTDPAVEFRFTPTFGRILALLRAGGVDITG